MNKKILGLLLTLTLVAGIFSFIEFAHAEPGDINEDDLYNHVVAHLQVRMFKWQNNQWVSYLNRTFKYKNTTDVWYAKKGLYQNSAPTTCTSVIKPNSKVYNLTYSYIFYLNICFEESNSSNEGYDDIFLSIGGNENSSKITGQYNQKKKLVFIDAIFACGAYKKEIWRDDTNEKIFDYYSKTDPNSDQQVYAQQRAAKFTFEDTMTPEYASDGAGWSPTGGDDISYTGTPTNFTMADVLARLRVDIRSWNGTYWLWCYSRQRYQKESDNSAKWWNKYYIDDNSYYITINSTNQQQIEKTVITIEDARDGNLSYAKKESFNDLVITVVLITDWYSASGGPVWNTVKQVAKLDWVCCLGGLRKQVWWERNYFKSKQWGNATHLGTPCFSPGAGFSESDYTHFAYDIPLYTKTW
jgi:hypothetical protein